MATLDWQLERAGEATLVELRVNSDATVRVDIESNLKPVWPPRRRNRPAAGWTDEGFEGVVAAGEPLVLGYASPADPVDPPATIVDTEPASGTPAESPTPAALVRALGEAGPPRDAVPAAGSTATDRSQSRESPPPAGNGSTPRSPGERSRSAGSPSGESSPAAESAESSGGRSPASGPATRGGGAREQAPGEAVTAWLDAVERRLATAERLAAVETAGEARSAVRAAGGIEAVRGLCERLDADRERFERIGTRTAEVEQRLAAVEVPLSALERLA